MLVIILATISTNTAANVVSPTNDFQNVAPRLINQTKGVLLTGAIGILLMCWELLKKMGWLESDVSVESLYSNWLIGYSSLLGPIAGIMIMDYFIDPPAEARPARPLQGRRAVSAWNRRDSSRSSCRLRLLFSRSRPVAPLVLRLRLVHGLPARRIALLSAGRQR